MELQRAAICFVGILIFAYVSCQNINEIKDDLEKQFGEIPGIEGLNSSDLPQLEDVEKVLKEKCEKNGADPGAFDEIKNQQTGLKDCLEAQVKTDVLQTELEEAKKTGSMDEVFGKYCKKYPEIVGCVKNLTDTSKKCMNLQEQEAMNISMRILDDLQEFVCFKDGDRIAMFVAEGGVQCIEEQKVGIQDCLNKTIGARIPSDLSLSTIPSFVFSDRDCSDFDKVRTCVNKELERCKNTTPANIVDAFFKFLKKHMPCNHAETRAGAVLGDTPSSSTSFYISSILLVVTLIYVKLI